MRTRGTARVRPRRAVSAVPALLATLAAVALASAGGLAYAAPALAARPPAADSAVSGTVSLTLGRVSPAALRPGTALVVQGTARNLGGSTIKSAKVRLLLRTSTLNGRTSIDDWLTGGTVTDADAVLPGAVKIKNLTPGDTEAFTISVAAGHTPLGTLSTFGPRALAVEAVTSDKASRQLGLLRTTVVWSPPTAKSTRTRLSLLVPFTAGASENAGAPTAEVGESLATGGRMQRLLDAAADPAVSWALDPAVLESARRLAASGEVASADDDSAGATPSPSTSETTSGAAKSTTDAAARQAASAWLSTLKSRRGSRSTLALPYADPDLTSLFRSKKGGGLLATADRLGKAATQAALGSSLDTTIAWPGDGQVTPSGIGTLVKTGRTAIVLPASSQPPTTAMSSTPSGRSTVRSGSAELAGLLSDDQLTALFTAIGNPGEASSSAASGATSPAAATQTLLSQLAAISMQLPGQTRQVLAVAPRTWNPNPAAVQNLLDDLHASPWVSLEGVDDLRSATSTVARDEPAYRKSPTRFELPKGNISGAMAMLRDLNTLAPALSDPDAVVGPLQEQVVSLLSWSWRSRRKDLSDAGSGVRDDVGKLTGGIYLLVGEKTKTLAAHSASIPVVVYNTTPFPMHVEVELVPGSGQLSIPGKVRVYAVAGQRTQVLVPARAVANGNVTVEGRLLTPKGKQLGTTGSFTLRARPDWETGGTIAAGVVLGLLLIFGLLRGIGRGRTRIPPQSVPDVDDQAAGRRPPEPDQISEPVDIGPNLRENPESVVTGPSGEDATDLGARDLGRSPESPRPITRAEKPPRAASETRPATAAEASGPGVGTGPVGDSRRPAISRRTR